MDHNKILEDRSKDPELYKWRRKRGLCLRCGSAPDGTFDMEGRRCGKCRSAIRRERYEFEQSTHAKRKANREKKETERIRAKRLAAGLCVDCGAVLLKPIEKVHGLCENCEHDRDDILAMLREKDNTRKKTSGGFADAFDQFHETCLWFKRTVAAARRDGMRPGCEGCPYLRRRTAHDSNSFCPTASGTGPDTQDCLRWLTINACNPRKPRRKRGRPRKNEQRESDRESGT